VTKRIDNLLADYVRLNCKGNLGPSNAVMIKIIHELVRMIEASSSSHTLSDLPLPSPPPYETGISHRLDVSEPVPEPAASDDKPPVGEPFPAEESASATPEGAAAYADQYAILHAASPDTSSPSAEDDTAAEPDAALAVARLTVAEIADALGATVVEEPAQHVSAAAHARTPKVAKKG